MQQKLAEYRKENVVQWEKVPYYNYKKLLLKKNEEYQDVFEKAILKLKFTSKSWFKQKSGKLWKMLKEYINLLQKADLNETRNATRCNNRDNLLHLCFTLKIFIFSVA